MSTTEPKRMISVDHNALVRLIGALNGPDHYIRELQYTRSFPLGDDNPINILEKALEEDAVAFNTRVRMSPGEALTLGEQIGAQLKKAYTGAAAELSAEALSEVLAEKAVTEPVAEFDATQKAIEAALVAYNTNINKVPDSNPIELCVGSLAFPKDARYNGLHSGCGEYESAVVVSMEPFVLVSLMTDMRWGAQKAKDFFHSSFVDQAVFTRCLRRILK